MPPTGVRLNLIWCPLITQGGHWIQTTSALEGYRQKIPSLLHATWSRLYRVPGIKTFQLPRQTPVPGRKQWIGLAKITPHSSFKASSFHNHTTALW